eukprot:gnl/MRDRNA2_/MRDRNA2_60206_c0_seq1.p1 gnl/MRDRNA2_/MRDRNA2_60206_c0~~gnl/MRDRNA2_/MRDRNA2_60206_c0_seq1.p1  ORF type:complete len:243 (-),score=20.51 gnl/MRDRNA2_/MRDRNA2_60206_c0_seq1:243-971(-)
MGQGQGILKACNQNRVQLARPCHISRSRIFSSEEMEDTKDGAVLLNIYDLSKEFLLSNDISQEVLELGGAFHAGVEVFGQEWSFSPDGVDFNYPKTHDVHVYRQTIVIGYTDYEPEEVQGIVEDEMSLEWRGSSYDLLSRNCCSFSRALCNRLTGKLIPDWVDRLPRLLDAVTQPVRSVPDVGSLFAAVRRDRGCSVESMDSSISVATLATSLSATPKNDTFVLPHKRSFHASASPAFGMAY